MIEPGTEAPGFTLPDQDGNEISLSDLRGERVLLVFYPGDFSSVCTDQLSVYQQELVPKLPQGTKIFGVSVDSAFSHKAFQEKLGLGMPLLADFHPKGQVAKAYGAYLDERGHNARALVLVGPDGVVEWAYESPSPLEIPGPELVVDALAQRA